MKHLIKTMTLCTAIAFFQTNVIADNCGCDSTDNLRKMYIGIEGGISIPLKKTFKEKVPGNPALKNKGELSQSSMYGVILGYRFYPAMAAELNFQRKPSYKLKITTPNIPTPIPGVVVPSGSTTTKVRSDLFLLGIVYDLPNVGHFTPYVGFDAGVARISHSATSIYSNIPALGGNAEIVRFKKASMIAPAFQMNLGVTTAELLPNTQLYAAARMQIIKGAKIKYSTRNPFTGVLTPESFKKTIGVGEFVVGITYNLPW